MSAPAPMVLTDEDRATILAAPYPHALPLAYATGAHADLLVTLAERYAHTSWRPCLDDETTLSDWQDVARGGHRRVTL